MDADAVTNIIVATISATGAIMAREGIDRFKLWRSGVEKRKRSEIDSLAQERTVAEEARDSALIEAMALRERLDTEAAKRRKYAEHASDLRRTLMESCGVPASDLPAWPE